MLSFPLLSSKQIVDHHRTLFYEHIDDGFDVFVHTEDDTLIRPTTVVSFMHEMEKVRLLVGDEVRLRQPTAFTINLKLEVEASNCFIFIYKVSTMICSRGLIYINKFFLL
jgi:hypothetical protein